MRPSQLLPDNYRLLRTIDLRKEPGLVILLNLIGLVLFALFGGLLFVIMVRVHPELSAGQITISGNFASMLRSIAVILAAYAGSLVLHELIHGACFWWFTRSAPTFGIGSAYAYAAAPGWYIPRNLYLIVGLAPLVMITLTGLLLLPLLPGTALLGWWIALTTNASGAVGDMYIVGWLLTRPGSTLINDHGDKICVYASA